MNLARSYYIGKPVYVLEWAGDGAKVIPCQTTLVGLDFIAARKSRYDKAALFQPVVPGKERVMRERTDSTRKRLLFADEEAAARAMRLAAKMSPKRGGN